MAGDVVNHPKHYTQYKHEVIELTEKLGFCLGNAVKYILRAKFKGHEEEDLKKASWYLKRIFASRAEPMAELHHGEYGMTEEQLIALADSYGNEFVSRLIRGFLRNELDLSAHQLVLENMALRARLTRYEELDGVRVAFIRATGMY